MIFKSHSLFRQLPYIVVETVPDMKPTNITSTISTSAVSSVVVAAPPATPNLSFRGANYNGSMCNHSKLDVPIHSRRTSRGSNRLIEEIYTL